MKTKFDILQENAEIRAKREQNLATLNKDLKEAKGILAVIPHNGGFEVMQEHDVMRRRIEELNDLIADETRALESLEWADDASVSKIVENMEV